MLFEVAIKLDCFSTHGTIYKWQKYTMHIIEWAGYEIWLTKQYDASATELSASFSRCLNFYVLRLLFSIVLILAHPIWLQMVNSQRSIEFLLHYLFAFGLLKSSDVLDGRIKHFLYILSTLSWGLEILHLIELSHSFNLFLKLAAFLTEL